MSASVNEHIWIQGGGSERDFICTQGPMQNTMADFWRMVWEQNVRIIVMLTPLRHKDIVRKTHSACVYVCFCADVCACAGQFLCTSTSLLCKKPQELWILYTGNKGESQLMLLQTHKVRERKKIVMDRWALNVSYSVQSMFFFFF